MNLFDLIQAKLLAEKAADNPLGPGPLMQRARYGDPNAVPSGTAPGWTSEVAAGAPITRVKVLTPAPTGAAPGWTGSVGENAPIRNIARNPQEILGGMRAGMERALGAAEATRLPEMIERLWNWRGIQEDPEGYMRAVEEAIPGWSEIYDPRKHPLSLPAEPAPAAPKPGVLSPEAASMVGGGGPLRVLPEYAAAPAAASPVPVAPPPSPPQVLASGEPEPTPAEPSAPWPLPEGFRPQGEPAGDRMGWGMGQLPVLSEMTKEEKRKHVALGKKILDAFGGFVDAAFGPHGKSLTKTEKAFGALRAVMGGIGNYAKMETGQRPGPGLFPRMEAYGTRTAGGKVEQQYRDMVAGVANDPSMTPWEKRAAVSLMSGRAPTPMDPLLKARAQSDLMLSRAAQTAAFRRATKANKIDTETKTINGKKMERKVLRDPYTGEMIRPLEEWSAAYKGEGSKGATETQTRKGKGIMELRRRYTALPEKERRIFRRKHVTDATWNEMLQRQPQDTDESYAKFLNVAGIAPDSMPEDLVKEAPKDFEVTYRLQDLTQRDLEYESNIYREQHGGKDPPSDEAFIEWLVNDRGYKP